MMFSSCHDKGGTTNIHYESIVRITSSSGEHAQCVHEIDSYAIHKSHLYQRMVASFNDLKMIEFDFRRKAIFIAAVVSDWQAISTTVEARSSSLNLQQPQEVQVSFPPNLFIYGMRNEQLMADRQA